MVYAADLHNFVEDRMNLPTPSYRTTGGQPTKKVDVVAFSSSAARLRGVELSSSHAVLE